MLGRLGGEMNETVVKHKFQIGETVKIISSGPYKDEEGKIIHIDASWGRDNRNGNRIDYTNVQYTVNVNGSPFLCCNEHELTKLENEKCKVLSDMENNC